MNEYGKLRQVTLVSPRNIPRHVQPESALYERRPRSWRWKGQAGALAIALKRAGVKVHRVVQPRGDNCANFMFQRDLFFRLSPGHLLMANPGGLRRYEPAILTPDLLGLPYMKVHEWMGHPATFEGADAIWLRSGILAMGVGHRTNHAAFRQMEAFLGSDHIELIPLGDENKGLHLLGHVNIISRSLAVVRESAPRYLFGLLRDLGYHIVECPELLADRGAMNFVTVAPDDIIVPSGSHHLVRRLRKDYGLITTEVPASEYLRAGGAIACATGVVERDNDA